MERLIKIGNVVKKKSSEIEKSRIGLGFEKLDRGVFDPEKVYDKVEETGVKWIRLQSGWARTEKEKGVYDFKWLDDVVDNLLARGLKPWLCLCYGNGLYSEDAAKIFGAVGVPPIFDEESKRAWANYVEATVKRYIGKIDLFEVWNEPDGHWCWKHGINLTEVGQFNIDTAKAIKKGNLDAKVVGGVMCKRSLRDMTEAFETGMGDYLDYVSYHQYTHDESTVIPYVKALRSLCESYNNKIKIIQGESGSQSRSDGRGAVRRGCWTPLKQAKQLLRHTVVDLISGVEFASYFSCVDMIEALNGVVGDAASYNDFGYFGVLGVEFDENGMPKDEYKPKISFGALQTLSSIFYNDYECCDVPVYRVPQESPRIFGMDCNDASIVQQGFSKPNGSKAFVYWNATNIMTADYESTVTYDVAHLGDDIKIIDLMNGTVYKFSEDMIQDTGFGTFKLVNIPLKDYPLMITFGDFAETE